MADVKLNLIDHSNDQNNSEIVIFSKNVATNFEETAVAWVVVKNLGQGSHHPFVYPEQTDVAVSDSWGQLLTAICSRSRRCFSNDHDGFGQ
jgi:hypothetical protein